MLQIFIGIRTFMFFGRECCKYSLKFRNEKKDSFAVNWSCCGMAGPYFFSLLSLRIFSSVKKAASSASAMMRSVSLSVFLVCNDSVSS